MDTIVVIYQNGKREGQREPIGYAPDTKTAKVMLAQLETTHETTHEIALKYLYACQEALQEYKRVNEEPSYSENRVAHAKWSNALDEYANYLIAEPGPKQLYHSNITMPPVTQEALLLLKVEYHFIKLRNEYYGNNPYDTEEVRPIEWAFPYLKDINK